MDQGNSIPLINPSFNSNLLSILLDLNHLRRFNLGGSTPPWLFFQLKGIFHLLESISSARIEGNRTTISEYIERKLTAPRKVSEDIAEIDNIEKAIAYIEETVDEATPITGLFIRELHQLVVAGLTREGDKTPGAYRNHAVDITQSPHTPPAHYLVEEYMAELVRFINHDDGDKYDLIKTAIAHHRFVWIHPFGNGNGRVVRLLNYALLIKYGFRVKDGQLINPTAVFCNDREKYYEMLSVADGGGDDAMEQWCEYALGGLQTEMAKIYKLLEHRFLLDKILYPALAHGRLFDWIDKKEEEILKVGLGEGAAFKVSDVTGRLKMPGRTATYIVKKLKDKKMLLPTKEDGRQYIVSIENNYLIRGVIDALVKEGFIPSFLK